MNSELTVGTFNAIKDRFVKMTNEETFLKEASFAMQIIAKNSQLQKCPQKSIVQSVLNVGQIGLTLNPALKWAYLVPRYNSASGETECFLEPSYQGLVKLITDTGSAKKVYCYPVYEGDLFDVSFGFDVQVTHKPQYKSKKLTHFYAVSELHDGSKMVEVMAIEDVYLIRDRSEGYKAFVANKIKSTPWATDETEMGRKTVIKRLCKYLPKTDMWDRLADAVELDNSDYPASEDQKGYIESLLRTSNIDHDERSRIERQTQFMSISQAVTMIEYLQENQLDPIASGQTYGQREISAKTRVEIESPKELLTNLFEKNPEK